MDGKSIGYGILYFIISIVIAWVALSLVLFWWHPSVYHTDGSVNWVNTLWIVVVAMVFAWLITIILKLIIDAIEAAVLKNKNKKSNCDPCAKPVDPCDKPVDPCAKPECAQVVAIVTPAPNVTQVAAPGQPGPINYTNVFG